ncbi:winged helix-turn-helix domain-containing protein [Sporosarcina thermotolerans]|uniref:Winged helix-turn-helix domain-containing protein n=1 Tax=Sporosarcina thermotolerans TaxID=633404 RepID=A0AAW9A8H2_9BACL|nr:winged helix-turn-helix domain-containing protein [Sporosarcina thermotolerans]MDW0116170.1 winged helix-turn-helix domain-containing protein [Sporosarcina thermotolerans]WHT48146.1 winged helix-turn-helix domain-containing protein [Sporosarcina thermotolerans]
MKTKQIIHRDAIVYHLVQELMRRKDLNLPALPLQEAYRLLANRFNLSDADLSKANKSDGSNKWETEVRFACAFLREQRIVRKLYGKLELTDEGYEKMGKLFWVLKGPSNKQNQ